MSDGTPDPRKYPPRRLAALAVHAFTASGAILGFLGLLAAIEERFTLMFVWLALALVVDGVDGTIARKVGVKAVEPRFSGEILDLIVDFLTYVVVPTYALVISGLLPAPLALPLAGAILVSSAFYFADGEMKTADGGFRGFPALWNIAAFLLFALGLGATANALIVVALIGLTFAPIVAVHPFRTRRWRGVIWALLILWSGAAATALAYHLAPPDPARWLLAIASLGLFAIGLTFGRAKPA